MDNFLFRKEWYDVIAHCPRETQLIVYDYVFDFVFYNVEPKEDYSNPAYVAFLFIKSGYLQSISKLQADRVKNVARATAAAAARWKNNPKNELKGTNNDADDANSSPDKLTKTPKKDHNKKPKTTDKMELEILLYWNTGNSFMPSESFPSTLHNYDAKQIKAAIDYARNKPSLTGQTGKKKMDIKWFAANIDTLLSEATQVVTYPYYDFVKKFNCTPVPGSGWCVLSERTPDGYYIYCKTEDAERAGLSIDKVI